MTKHLVCLIVSIFMLAAESSATWVDVYGDLSVSGNNIMGSEGRIVTLRGMSFYWSVWDGQDFYRTETVDWLVSDWNCNVVRAAMSVTHSDGYAWNQDRQKNYVRTVVNAAIANGIYVIIDYHSHDATNDVNMAKGFFAQMAQEFGQYPNVMYEIFNEPINQSWGQVKAYSEAVIDEIRLHDPDNIIIVGSPHWSTDVNLAVDDPITGRSNLVYTVHFYAATHQFTGTQEFDPIVKAKYALAKGLPMFVTEFGTCSSNGDGGYDYNSAGAWLDWCDANGIGYCKWSVHDLSESSAILNTSATSGWSTNQLKGSGQWIRARILEKNAVIPDPSDPGIPSVEILSPADNSTVEIGVPVEIQVNATDSDGSIVKVELLVDNTVHSEGQNAGHTFVLNSLGPGSYSIEVRATDNEGKTATDNITIEVFDPSAYHLKANCGGDVAGWENASTYATGGDPFTFSANVSTAGVAGAAPAEVYRTVLHGGSGQVYDIDVPDGDYNVILHTYDEYAENRRRSMIFTIEGTVVEPDFAPESTPEVHTYDVTVSDGNGLTIEIATAVVDAFISGFEVKGTSSTGTIGTTVYSRPRSGLYRPGSGIRTLEVVNLKGIVIKRIQDNGSPIVTFTTSDMASGIYVLRAAAQTGIFFVRFAVHR